MTIDPHVYLATPFIASGLSTRTIERAAHDAYIREGTMTFSYLEGWWTDAGTFDSLLRAGNLVAGSAGAASSVGTTSND